MKAVVTGASGFIGRNLVVALQRAGVSVAEVDVDAGPEAWRAAVSGASVVYHLAGVNRPLEDREFFEGNVGSLDTLFAALAAAGPAGPLRAHPLVVLSSSTQADKHNPYGRSKLTAEHALEAYAARTGSAAVIYRLPGVFGKWCRPDYNSVVATFCHHVARGAPIVISDPARLVELVHVDDVVARFLGHLGGQASGVARGDVGPVFTLSLGELSDRIRAFRSMRDTLLVPDASDPLTRRLLGTYVAYLQPGDLAYRLAQRRDDRGTLAELLKSAHFGQIFVSRTKPGVTRGNHYHDLKVEKFCVLDGEAVIRFRQVSGGDVIEYRVSGSDFTVVDIPPGMTHSIENVGSTELIVLFWASEILDPQRPDTYPSEVQRD